MFVFTLVEKEFSEIFVAGATVQTGQQVAKKTAPQIGSKVSSKSAGAAAKKASPQVKAATKSKNTVSGTVKTAPQFKTATKSKTWVAGALKTVPQSNTTAKSKKMVTGTTTNGIIGKTVKSQFVQQVPQKKLFVEETVSKDRSWNIYTGNPGFYITEGDNINFGNVTTLSDSAFLEARQTVVPKTIKPYGIVGKELVVPGQDWVLGIILIFWMIFASVRVGFLKYLGQLFVSLVSFSAATRLYQQRGYKTMYGALRLDLIFHLILPLAVFQIAEYYKVDIPGYPAVLFFLALLLIINGYIFTKILLLRVAGSIVMLKEQTDETVFNIKLYYKALGLILLPVVTIHAIIDESNLITTWVMAGFIAIMYIATVIRTIFVGNRKDISNFYLILYLCTLEILPLLLIFKLMSSE